MDGLNYSNEYKVRKPGWGQIILQNYLSDINFLRHNQSSNQAIIQDGKSDFLRIWTTGAN